MKNTDKKIEKTNDTMTSTHHTLFKKKIPSKNIPLKNNKSAFTTAGEYNKYTFYVDDFMEFGKGLHSIYNELWNASDNDILELRINSNGGMINEGGQFYSIIKNKFNGRTTTILDNKGYSMGALLFLMGDKRVITERADFMLHTYAGGMFGKSGEMEARNTHTQEHLDKFFREIIVNGKFLSEKEYKNMKIGQDYWFSTKELCERGIATHILINGKEIKASKYLKSLKGGK